MKAALFVLASYSGSAMAADLSRAEAECGQLEPQRDGVTCVVATVNGMGQTLLIRIHTRGDPPPKKDKRIQYVLRVVMDAFMRAGGTFMVQRVNLENGRLMERTCSRERRTVTEDCQEWQKVGKDEQAMDTLFKPLDP